MLETTLIHETEPLVNALRKIDSNQLKALICIDSEKKLKGVLVDGDIRRGLLKGADLNDSIESVMNKSPLFLNKSATKEEVEKLISTKIRILPIIDENKVVVDVHTFKEKNTETYIRNKNITILGMGYVGLTLGLVLADNGFNVNGFDINDSLIEDLNEKKEPFFEEKLKSFLDKLTNKRITFTTNLDKAKADVYIITVGTPLLKDSKTPNIDHIKKATGSIGKVIKKGDLVILRSTVPTGLTKKVVIPELENQSGLTCGEDFYVSFAPERTAEGIALRELRTNPQIIGAFDSDSYDITARIFQTITHSIIDVGSLEAAETCKLIDNTYRDHVFAYTNNMAMLTEKLGLNLNELINAVNFGYERNRIPKPSPGVGGPCLSKDPYILSQVFRENDLNEGLILESRRVNEFGPVHLKKKLDYLLHSINKSPETVKISLIGMAFKGFPETSDLRDSTSLWFLEQLKEYKNIYAYDPVIDDEDLKEIGVIPVNLEEAFKNTDAVIILNNHKSYQKWNITQLFKTMNKPSVFIDTWNNFNPLTIKQHKGIVYGGLGND